MIFDAKTGRFGVLTPSNANDDAVEAVTPAMIEAGKRAGNDWRGLDEANLYRDIYLAMRAAHVTAQRPE